MTHENIYYGDLDVCNYYIHHTNMEADDSSDRSG
jgi:hypothetical protein